MSHSFNDLRNTLLIRALGIAGLNDEGVPHSADLINEASDSLAVLLRNLQEDGTPFWLEDWMTVPLVAGSNVSYGGKYYRCLKEHTAGVDSEPGVGSESSTYWYEDAGATTGAVPWVLLDPYTSRGELLPDVDTYAIVRAYVRFSGYDYPLTMISRPDFMDIPDKQVLGRPDRCWYNRLQDSGLVHFHPFPDSGSYVLHYLRIRFIDDMPEAGDPLDLPQSWVMPLTYLLGAFIGDQHKMKVERSQYLRGVGMGMLTKSKTAPIKDTSNSSRIKPCY